MSGNTPMDHPDEPGADVSPKTLFMLERLDSLAHVVVAVFFLILSAGVLITAGILFIHGVSEALHPGDDRLLHFTHSTLEVLSTLLFAVIILELLRTIITYLQSRDTHAIMKEFLIVGIISSVRKILMIGAESSIIGGNVAESNLEHKLLAQQIFVQESIGVILSVGAILLMIGGLIMLNRYYGSAEPRPVSKISA